MIDELLLHPSVRKEIEAILQGQTHAVSLIGPHGAGKGTLARVLAASYLGKQTIDALQNEPYLTVIVPDGQSIGIAAVRELQKFMSLKTLGAGAIRRIALIEDAETMTSEAQNALLKLIEEPPADTVIILTADHQQHLLPTVNSRVQTITILPPSKSETIAYFERQKYATVDIERAYLISDGQVGLLYAILADNTSHPLVAHIDQAKHIYGMKTFERLATVEELSKQKEALPELLTALKRISKTALEQAAGKDQKDVAARWLERLTVIHDAEAALQKNANAKLLLTDLMLHL